jgi:hypothetical protein
MKIFPKESAAAPIVNKSGKGKNAPAPKKGSSVSAKNGNLPLKKQISPDEIREKLAARVETSDAAKILTIKNNSTKHGAGFLSEEFTPAPVIAPVETPKSDDSPNTADFVLKSDIANNDPKNTNTQEKLKSVISKGGFNFNPKEREALERILAGA